MATTLINFATLPSFLVSGLIINLLQILIYFLVRPFNKDLFRTWNHYLNYSSWSQTVAVADWGSQLKCRVWVKDQETRREFGKATALVIMNHRHDLDWLVPWMYSDKLGTLGSDKAMVKASLRRIPIIGWGWIISDMIFLYRDWKRDRENLAKTMDILLTYPRSLILSFFEGTRFTKAKYEASCKFAKERGLPALKHHLLPRTRGFNSMMHHVHRRLKEDPNLKFSIYNMQVALRDKHGNENPSLLSVMSGKPATVYIYVERVDVNNVPVDSEEATSNFLYNLYKTKDELAEYFEEKEEFPGIELEYKPRVWSLVNWLGWIVVTYTWIAYILFKVFTSNSSSYILLASVVAVVTLVVIIIRKMIASTKVSQSSSYGAKLN